MNEILGSITDEYRRYKAIGEGAMRQLDVDELCAPSPGDGLSVASLVWHLAGNLTSRFTDFLTSDGEKPWRDRDGEFLPRHVSRAELEQEWERGWAVLLEALDELTDAQLAETVTIRGQHWTVHGALHRSLAHTSYHVGQMVLIAKGIRGSGWTSLSIPPGESRRYARNPKLERGPGSP